MYIGNGSMQRTLDTGTVECRYTRHRSVNRLFDKFVQEIVWHRLATKNHPQEIRSQQNTVSKVISYNGISYIPCECHNHACRQSAHNLLLNYQYKLSNWMYIL